MKLQGVLLITLAAIWRTYSDSFDDEYRFNIGCRFDERDLVEYYHFSLTKGSCTANGGNVDLEHGQSCHFKCAEGYFHSNSTQDSLIPYTCNAEDYLENEEDSLIPCQEQTCTFESSEVVTEDNDDNFDLDECFAISLAESADNFTLTAARGRTSCTAECKPGFEKVGGSGEIKCLKNGNAEFGIKAFSSFECREQTCTFKVSDLTTDNADLSNCLINPSSPSDSLILDAGLILDAEYFTLNAVSGQTSCVAGCTRRYTLFGSGLIQCLKNGNSPVGRKFSSSFTCREICSPLLQSRCKQENRRPCRPGSRVCGPCLPEYIENGDSCVAACDITKKRKCTLLNRVPCTTQQPDCGPCLKNYVAVDRTKGAICERRLIDVPFLAHISGIQLQTRVQRVYLQTAFRKMAALLSAETDSIRNDFESIDTSKLYLVHTHEESKDVWQARFKMTFRTSEQHPGWSESSILKSMKSCERLNIAEKMIIRETEFPEAILDYMQVLKADQKISQSDCRKVATNTQVSRCPIVIDVRPRTHWDTGHAPCAYHMEIGSNRTLTNELLLLANGNQDRPVRVYSNDGFTASYVARILRGERWTQVTHDLGWLKDAERITKACACDDLSGDSSSDSEIATADGDTGPISAGIVSGILVLLAVLAATMGYVHRERVKKTWMACREPVKRPWSERVKTVLGAFSERVQTAWRVCRERVQTAWRVCRERVQTAWRVCRERVQIAWRVCRERVQMAWRAVMRKVR